MPKQVLLWGSGEVATVLMHLIRETGLFEVVGFCVDDEVWESGMEVNGIEVIKLSEAVAKFPPDKVGIMAAVGFKRLNRVRREVLDKLISLEYKPVSFIHPTAYVSPSVELGRHVLIMPNVVLEPNVKVEENAFIWSGATICHDVKVEKDSFIASGVVVGGGSVIGEGSFLGMNAVVRDHRTIGRRCVVGAGAYVGRDIPDNHMIKLSNQAQQTLPMDAPPL